MTDDSIICIMYSIVTERRSPEFAVCFLLSIRNAANIMNSKTSEKKVRILKDPNESDSLTLARPVIERKKNELYLFFCEAPSFQNVCMTKRNLHTLVIIGQLHVTSLDGISNLNNLRELWAVECRVKDISDLWGCRKLEKLYLYSNDINGVPDMSNNSSLRLLSLSGNNISHLRNLQSIPKLEELHLANNCIKQIGDSFQQNINLSFINLAGNYLYQLKDIKNLSFLPNLQSIVFADPLYGKCPLVSLSNYRNFVINYLPGLIRLDYYTINAEERFYVKEFFESKMLFYNMLFHKYLFNFTKSLKDHTEKSRQRTSKYREEIYLAKLEQLRVKFKLYPHHEPILNVFERILTLEQIAASSDIGVVSKELLSYEKLQQLFSRVDTKDAVDEKLIENTEMNLQIMQRQLNLTVQHCGNMKFVEYNPDTGKTLVKICQDICDDSLCSTVRQDLGIVGVYVNRVTKAVNKETDVLRSYEYFSECETDEKQSESVFTFLVKPVGVVELEKWPFEIFENEFFGTSEIITSDCLAAADADWMESILSNRKSSAMPLPLLNERRIATLIQLPASTRTMKVEKRDSYHTMHSNHNDEMCQCLFLANPSQAKPIFAIEYEYIFENGLQRDRRKIPGTKFARTSLLKSWERMSFENMKHCLDLTDLEVHKLQVINLSGQGICTINLETPLPNLRELNLSFNKLTEIPDSAMLKYIRKLDVSFNYICSFEIAALLPSLKNFNVAWNRLREFLTILKMVKAFVPNLTMLDVGHNPFIDVTKRESMFLLANATLPSLKYLNEKRLQDSFYSKPVIQKPWRIEMFEMADIAKFKIIKEAADVRVISNANSSLTSLSISEEQLKDVQYVNLSDNHLKSVEFITEFHELREVYLINNLVVEISLKKSANQLTKLSLFGNFITTADGLSQENFPVLNYLDLCNNLITSTKAMGAFHTLIEFYCSNNKISNLSEISNLKNWHGLKIIDILHNPIDSTNLCKKFIIFLVSNVEYVDGERVNAADISAANETFGGSLDKDMIMNMPNVGKDLTNLRQLSMVNCAVKKVSDEVDITTNLLPNLESLDLRHNELTTLWGLHSLKKLRTLCLSYNQIQTSISVIYPKDILSAECWFPRLNSLFLDHNGIRSMVDFNFQNMPALSHLYLQHNELYDVNGVQNCTKLKTLVLDCNKIQMITEEDFHTENNIKALLLENNRIKFLCFIKRLSNIEKLFISNNKVADRDQLDYLGTLKNLKEITMLGNPFCKKINHYKLAMRALSTLRHIDGHSMILKEYSTVNPWHCIVKL